ncbi:hypothetical protein HDV00_012023 [Rhizophlyctis rosea]|nr:hypothetical protein HDV00_012023 [Rhizophlyctis rosea]
MSSLEADRLQEFCTYLEDRKRIELKRSLGHPSPWTPNHILHHYHFCCIRREDDRTSKILATEIFATANPFKDPHFLWNVMFHRGVMFHRHVSNAPFNRELGYVTDPKVAMENLSEWEKTETKWRTKAFTSSVEKKLFKRKMQDNWHAAQAWNRDLWPHNGQLPTQRDVARALVELQLVGKFHAYQAYLDAVMYGAAQFDPGHVDLGPGAIKGLRYLLGMDMAGGDIPESENMVIYLTAEVNLELQERERTRQQWDTANVGLEDELLGSGFGNLRPLDIEHALCEFQKYVTIKKKGKAKPRPYWRHPPTTSPMAKYPPTADVDAYLDTVREYEEDFRAYERDLIKLRMDDERWMREAGFFDP